jgi:hypothetical protein
MANPAGANADIFDDMVRQTIGRYVARKERDELLDILAFIIRMERAKSAMRE